MSDIDNIDERQSEENEHSESDEEQAQELQRQKIRDNLSNLSFEDLIKLKEKLGSKLYNRAVHGISQTQKLQKELKRVNKNRPREISSKIKPKHIKAILCKNSNSLMPMSKIRAPRDPRFDPTCGEFDKLTFKQNYGFVNELRQKEKEKLQEEYRECTDPERKKTIKMLIQRIDNQIREEEKMNRIKEKEEDEKKEIREKIRQGEKPVYKKKSVKKLEGLVEKYEELKKTNRLQKHIQKRAKKMKVKDKKIIEKIK